MHNSHTPMLYVLLPLLVGVIAAGATTPTYPILAISLAVAGLLTMIIWQRANVLIYPAIACIGYVIAALNSPSEAIKEQRNALFTLEVNDSADGTITSIAAEDDTWQSTQHKALLWGADSLRNTTICARGDIRLIDPARSDYYKAMARRGYEVSVTIKEVTTSTHSSASLSAKLNHWATARLSTLGLRGEAFTLAAAVGLARRDGLDQQTITNYNRSGTSHLLALSGLHLSIIVLIISALTYYLPLLRNGHIAADIIAIIAIWLFATMAGLSESVMRAAWMFSLLKLSSIISRQYNSLNALLTAAVIIISFNPTALYDLSFTLSFTAVAAIILAGIPLLRVLHTKSEIVNFVVSSVVIGTVATIATAPLISNAFGYIVVLSPLATLPLLLTIFVIILFTTLWVVAPLPLLKPLFYWVLEVSTTVQNHLVEWFASWNIGVINYRLSDWGVAASYLAMGIIFATATYFIKRAKRLAEKYKRFIEPYEYDEL